MTVVRDIKVKLRISAAFIEQEERGSEKPGKDSKGGQRHVVEDMPEIVVDFDEWKRRMSDAALVLHEGWELDNDGPPAVRTGGVTAIGEHGATLHAYIDTPAECTCGFLYDTKRDVDAHTQDAVQSPVAANFDDLEITTVLAGLTPGTKYYYRPWINRAGINTRYGAVRSFVTSEEIA